LPHSPLATEGGGALMGLASPKQSSKSPPNLNMKHTIKQWCLFKFQNSKPHCTNVKPPPIEDFLVTVPLPHQTFH